MFPDNDFEFKITLDDVEDLRDKVTDEFISRACDVIAILKTLVEKDVLFHGKDLLIRQAISELNTMLILDERKQNLRNTLSTIKKSRIY